MVKKISKQTRRDMVDNVYGIPNDWETSTSFSHGLFVTDDPGIVWATKANVDLF